MTNKIIETICSYFSLTKEQLLSKSRKRKLVIARQYTVFLLRKYGITYERIGEYLNLNHATCVYSIKTINDLLSVDRETERQLEEIENFITTL
jgi:chromosomal replication initiator protein